MALVLTEHFGIPKPDTDLDVDDEFYKLGEIWDLIDTLLWQISQSVDGKAPVDHGHSIEEIAGLVLALSEKMPANAQFQLDDLVDVVNANAAPAGYILVKNAEGQWTPYSPAAALGPHQHGIGDVLNLEVALDLRGMRNRLINGGFDVWQRGVSQTLNGYGSADRWSCAHLGSTKTASRQAFALGQTEVPGNPAYFIRHVINSVAGAANYCSLNQRIEGVRSLAGKTATLTFWAKADAARSIAVEFWQRFGTGGSPSSDVFGGPVQKLAITTSWKKYTVKGLIPSILGKTLGSNGDDFLALSIWFDAGANHNLRTGNLGQQSGTFEIARVSLVEGDATDEEDPFSPRHPQQELTLCQRYYEAHTVSSIGLLYRGNVTSGQVYATLVHFLVEKRAVPSISISNDGFINFASPISVNSVTTQSFRANATASATNIAQFNSMWEADSEL
jgi:hypothetical protein